MSLSFQELHFVLLPLWRAGPGLAGFVVCVGGFSICLVGTVFPIICLVVNVFPTICLVGNIFSVLPFPLPTIALFLIVFHNLPCL